MFRYDDAIVERFPTIRAGVVDAAGLTNGPSTPDLLAAYRAEQHAVSERLATTAIAEHASIAAWRRVFTAFGAKPTQHRNAAEALLRRLHKSGDIPSISTLVDIGNLVSIRYAMPVAVFDRAKLAGDITVRFARGSEPFADLGSSEAVHPEPGEVVFVDEDDVVCARRWCWRQSAHSATGSTTSEALIVVEGHHDTAGRDVESAVADLAELLASHQPASQTASYAVSSVTSVHDSGSTT
jgi:DNA/RNA-binding domain of Phe-tRNA-synthetase-like protein